MPSSSSHSDLNIVLVGVTGCGKSTTGNTMCGREAFKASDSAESETRKCSLERYTHNDCSVCLVDTVGLADTSLTAPEALNRFLEFSDSVHAGVDAFFYIIRRDVRFAPQDEASLQAFVSACGEDVLKHTVLVFTHCKPEHQDEAGLKEWARQNQNLKKWVSRARAIIGVENEENPSVACDALHAQAMLVSQENRRKKYSNKPLDEARERRKKLESQVANLYPENQPEVYQLLVELAAGRCKYTDVEAKLEAVQNREREQKKKDEKLLKAQRKAEQAEEGRLEAERQLLEERQVKKENEEFFQDLDRMKKAAGCSPWKKGSSSTKKEGDMLRRTEVVMIQELMPISVKHSGNGQKKGEVKVWSEVKTNNGWSESCPLPIPQTMMMEPGPETQLKHLIPKVHSLLQADLERSLRVLERKQTAAIQKKDKQGNVSFSIKTCTLSKVLFGAQPQDDYNYHLEIYSGGQLDLLIRLEVKQIRKHQKGSCCTIQ